MNQFEPELSGLFEEYRHACPDPEPGPNFMPSLWQRIDARRGFATQFGRLAKVLVAGSALACVLLAAFSWIPLASNPPMDNATYIDALASYHSPDKLVYADVVHSEGAEGSDLQ